MSGATHRSSMAGQLVPGNHTRIAAIESAVGSVQGLSMQVLLVVFTRLTIICQMKTLKITRQQDHHCTVRVRIR